MLVISSFLYGLALAEENFDELDRLTKVVQRINRYNRKLIRENAMLVDQLHDEGIDKGFLRFFLNKGGVTENRLLDFGFWAMAGIFCGALTCWLNLSNKNPSV